MPYLRLRLSDFSSSFGVGDPLRNGWRANWKAGMSWLESVKLTNGSDLAQMRGWLNLKAGEIESGPGTAIGSLSYFPASEGSADGVMEAQPATYYVEVVLDERQLLRLMELERQGHGPTGVSVDVPKLRYGHSPDGSDKEWDLGEHDSLAVEGVTFSFTREQEEADDPGETDEELPAHICPSAEVQAIRGLGNELGRVLAWIIGLLALIAIVLIAK
jgi:hypothetical protein